MAMYFEQKKKRRPVVQPRPKVELPSDDRYQSEHDLQAMIRAKKIKNDRERMMKARGMAREKLDIRKKKGFQARMIDSEDNLSGN